MATHGIDAHGSRKAMTQVTTSPSVTVNSCFRAHNMHSQNNGHLSKPFINVGMPKMGTSSLHNYFCCGNHTSSHWVCESHLCSICMENATKHGNPPLKTCGNYDVWSQMDNGVYFPQIELLDQLHEESPSATFILMFRNITDWYRSLSAWPPTNSNRAAGNLARDIESRNITGLPPGKGKNEEEFSEWFCSHVQRVRSFVATHPSHSLVELNMADLDAGRQLEHAFGVSEKCWGHVNKNAKVSHRALGTNAPWICNV